MEGDSSPGPSVRVCAGVGAGTPAAGSSLRGLTGAGEPVLLGEELAAAGGRGSPFEHASEKQTRTRRVATRTADALAQGGRSWRCLGVGGPRHKVGFRGTLSRMLRPYVYRMLVRYRDTDAQGHVYFANYLVFCDEAWGAYMRHIGMPYQDLTKLGVETFYVNARCDYSGSATYEDEVQIETRVTRLGRSSVTTAFGVRNEQGETLADASLTSVCVDRSTRKPAPIPDELRRLIREFEGAHLEEAG